MELTEEQAKERVASPSNLVKILVEHRKLNNGGKLPGDNNLTEEAATDVAVIGKLTSPSVAAEMFGLSGQQASNLKHGKRNGKTVDEKLKQRTEERIGTIKDRALESVLIAIGLLDESRLEDTKPRDLASIAKDLVTVHEKLSADEKTGANIHVHVFAPAVKELASFGEVIDITPQVKDR